MICVDSSVAVKWILEEEWTNQALALYFAALRNDDSLIVPPMLPIEVTNVLRQRMRGPAGPTLAEATEQLERLLDFGFTILDFDGMHQRALAIADAYNLPAAYDAHYLALSERFGCELWTDDRRLLRQVGKEMAFVRWIGDYQLPAS